MSCTVFALPYALAWVVGAVITGVAATADSLNENRFDYSNQTYSDLASMYSNQNCDDVHVITEKNFIEKSFETAFMDKDILIKTLEEHGVQGISTNEFGKITGQVNDYTLEFEKMETDKPYFLKITCLDKDKPEEKLDDLSSEYALNVQEEAYLNIVEKLKANNMQVEEEEVLEDNTIVLTVNLD